MTPKDKVILIQWASAFAAVVLVSVGVFMHYGIPTMLVVLGVMTQFFGENVETR